MTPPTLHLSRIRYWSWLPRNAAGVALCPYIFIRKDRKDDKALLAHEMVHWERQKKLGTVRWVFCYLASPTFRFEEEVLGYKKQIELGGMTKERAALSIAEKYKTGRGYAECLEALEK